MGGGSEWLRERRELMTKWRAYSFNDYSGSGTYIIEVETKTHVAKVLEHDDQDYSARLMAAAPEMLDALKWVIKWSEGPFLEKPIKKLINEMNLDEEVDFTERKIQMPVKEVNTFKSQPEARQNQFIHSLALDVCRLSAFVTTEDNKQYRLVAPVDEDFWELFEPQTDLNHTMMVLRGLSASEGPFKMAGDSILSEAFYSYYFFKEYAYADKEYVSYSFGPEEVDNILLASPEQHIEALWEMYKKGYLELPSMK